MKVRQAVAVLLWASSLGVLIQCGSSASTPSTPSTQSTPAPTPTPTPVGALPPGLVCNPTPPPLVKMEVTIKSTEGGRTVLDSKPLVENVDAYCERVGFGGWKFCPTRLEGNDQRVACDYMVTGKAKDTGRWGPTWYYNDQLCSVATSDCANHNTEQFLAIAKDAGNFTACAQDSYPVTAGRSNCGTLEVK